METSKPDIESLVLPYLLEYKYRYNQATPDSRPSHSGFCDWAAEYLPSKQCSYLEKKLLVKFLRWLDAQNNGHDPAKRLIGIGRSDLDQFLRETTLLDLLEPGPSGR